LLNGCGARKVPRPFILKGAKRLMGRDSANGLAVLKAEHDLLLGALHEEWFGRVPELRETVFLDGPCVVLALRSG